MKFSVATLFALFTIVYAGRDESLEERLEKHMHIMDNEESLLNLIKNHNDRRMAKLEEMIEDRRQLKEAHESGRRLLSDEDYDRTARQYRNFQRKLEQLKKRDSKEQHMERLEDLKALHARNPVRV